MRDGRAEESSAIGDRGQAAISLTPDVDGTGSGSLPELKQEGRGQGTIFKRMT